MRVAAKTPYPAAIAENGDLRARSDIFASRKIAAEERLDAERREEIDGRLRAKDELRFARSVKDESVTAGTSKRLEGFGLFRPIEVVRIRGDPTGRVRLPGLPFLETHFTEREQAAGLCVRERADKRSVDDGKDRRVCADA